MLLLIGPPTPCLAQEMAEEMVQAAGEVVGAATEREQVDPGASHTSSEAAPAVEESLALEEELAAIRAELEAVRADAAAAAAREAEAAASYEALERELEALEARRAEALEAEPSTDHSASRSADSLPSEPPSAVAIAPAPAASLRLRVNSNLRAGPGMNQPVRVTLPAGTRVEGFARVGDWTRVGLPDGLGGWIYSELLGPDLH